MASIRREFTVGMSAADAWDVIRDYGAVHTRLVPGFVTDTKLDGDARIVTFGNGSVVRERIVDLDDKRRRIAYSATGGRAEHHNATAEVFDGLETRIVWITDVLPNEIAGYITSQMDAAIPVMKKSLARTK
ncbi:MAG TPA: SRPBCC family protein [Rhizomicrobium sp.]|nr:SRPBCC family protein [Rhizomicrobium sp.]